MGPKPEEDDIPQDTSPVPMGEYSNVVEELKRRKTSTASSISKKSKEDDLHSVQAAPKDSDVPKRKVKYPLQVFFIVSNEFCERFSFYGLRTILTIYLSQQLLYSQDTSTIIYHTFNMLCYFSPLAGAIMADSWLGKYKTIFYVSLIYASGNILVAGGAVPSLSDAATKGLTFTGLLLIAFGTGGIKPCVSAFGGDQFILPEQELALQKFFSVFYFSINAGSFISTFITPILREDVQCFGDDSCYTLAFGVPAALMVVSVVVFVLGKPLYKIKVPRGNVIVKVIKCMGHAIANRKVKREHWLDRADDEYDKQFIDDIKCALRVMLLYVPLPIFWALFDQQGSRWTFQATRMTGKFNNFTLKPDQLQVLNPILILIFIPFFEIVLYPLLAKCGLLKRALPRIFVGGILAGIAFCLSAGVEHYIEPTYAVLPGENAAQLRFHNLLPCDIQLTSQAIDIDNTIIKSLQMYQKIKIKKQKEEVKYTINAAGCSMLEQTLSVKVVDAQGATIIIHENDPTSFTTTISSKENIDKSDSGDPNIRVLFSDASGTFNPFNLDFKLGDSKDPAKQIYINETFTKFEKIDSNRYNLYVESSLIGSIEPLQGGVYTLAFRRNSDGSYGHNLTEIAPPSSVNMLWLIPQYFVLTAGEVLLSITGIEFSYTQAPSSMKSVLTATWQLSIAVGNLLDIIIVELRIFSSQVYEYLLFAALMFFVMIIFAFLARNYQYVDRSHEVDDSDADDKNSHTSSEALSKF